MGSQGTDFHSKKSYKGLMKVSNSSKNSQVEAMNSGGQWAYICIVSFAAIFRLVTQLKLTIMDVTKTSLRVIINIIIKAGLHCSDITRGPQELRKK